MPLVDGKNILASALYDSATRHKAQSLPRFTGAAGFVSPVSLAGCGASPGSHQPRLAQPSVWRRRFQAINPSKPAPKSAMLAGSGIGVVTPAAMAVSGVDSKA
jgi:hypothetical protein